MRFDKKITFIYNSAYKGERYTINNKLDFKDPNNHITYYEISDDQEQIIVHFKSGKSFSYPHSKGQEENILNMMKEQTNDLKEEKTRLKKDIFTVEHNSKVIGGFAVVINTVLFFTFLFLNTEMSVSTMSSLFLMVNVNLALISGYFLYDEHKINKEIKRIELLEDIMDPELLKEKEYNKSNILVNTSNRMKKSQSAKTDYTKNELLNEMSRLAYIKNLKDLRTMVENIQYTNMLSKDKEKTYIKK